jgi:hypothetical protein
MTALGNATRTEQVLLLGFLPLLGATTQLSTAIMAAILVMLVTLILGLVSRRIPATRDDSLAWPLYAALGLAIAYVLTTAARYWMPLPDAVVPYLYVSGLTPLVFTGNIQGPLREHRTQLIFRFVLLMLGFGLLRESLGSGTLLGKTVWQDAAIPVGLLAQASGGLLVVAATAMIDSVVQTKKRPAKEGQV